MYNTCILAEGLRNIGKNVLRTPGEVLGVDAIVRTWRTSEEYKKESNVLTAPRVIGTNLAMQVLLPATNRATLDYQHGTHEDRSDFTNGEGMLGGGLFGFLLDATAYATVAGLTVTNHINAPEVVVLTAGIHAIEHKIVDAVPPISRFLTGILPAAIDGFLQRQRTPWS